MLKNGDLFNYFKNNILFKINKLSDAFALFQVGLYYTLTQKGYKAATYTYCHGYFSRKNPDICIMKYNLPIWKKKFFSEENYDSKICSSLFEYLDRNELYNTSLIEENAKRLYKYDDSKKICHNGIKNSCQSELKYSIPEINYDDINDFISKHKKIYIYGAGAFAKSTAFDFRDKIQEFAGFIVSDSKKYEDREVWGYPLIEASCVPSNSAIIVVLNYKYSEEVLTQLGNGENILYFWRLP